MPPAFYVYILASRTRRLYVGVTRDLVRRLEQHRTAGPETFTGRYLVRRLVHVERFATPMDAIGREKQLKGWSRSKKLALVTATNPTWADLSAFAEAERMLG